MPEIPVLLLDLTAGTVLGSIRAEQPDQDQILELQTLAVFAGRDEIVVLLVQPGFQALQSGRIFDQNS